MVLYVVTHAGGALLFHVASLHFTSFLLLPAGLEDVFKTSPFESFVFNRGQVVGRGILGANLKSVGVFKGVVRLCDTASEPSPVDMDALLSPRTHVIRVYVLNGQRIQPKDR